MRSLHPVRAGGWSAEAIAQAGLAGAGRLGPGTATIIGTGIGGADTIEAGIHNAYVTQQRVDPWSVPRLMPNAAASQLSARYGASGPSFAIASACASGAQAIGIGAQMVRSGAVERAIVGGAEACMTASGMKSWEALRVLSPDLCRPFSKDRNGMALGEGAAVFVLEGEAAMSDRGAVPVAEIVGFGTSSDAGDVVRPDASRRRGSDPGSGRGCRHRRSTPSTTSMRTAPAPSPTTLPRSAALRLVFGEGLERIPVSSTKPIHGHALGAGGAIELAVTLLAMRDGIVPPTINWTTPDPRCAIDCVPNRARAKRIRTAMSNSFAFGGINAVLLVGEVNQA